MGNFTITAPRTMDAEEVAERLFGTPPWAQEDVEERPHMVHLDGCSQARDWPTLTTLCGVAVEQSGNQSGAGVVVEVCPRCDTAPGCPVCGAARVTQGGDA